MGNLLADRALPVALWQRAQDGRWLSVRRALARRQDGGLGVSPRIPYPRAGCGVPKPERVPWHCPSLHAAATRAPKRGRLDSVAPPAALSIALVDTLEHGALVLD